MNPLEVNTLVLAFLGDSIYEIYVREYLVKKGITNVKDIQVESINYVSAINQAKYVKEMIDANFFSEEELHDINRFRNHKNNHHPKNCDVISYKYATALEAFIGYLYLNKEEERINSIMNYILRD